MFSLQLNRHCVNAFVKVSKVKDVDLYEESLALQLLWKKDSIFTLIPYPKMKIKPTDQISDNYNCKYAAYLPSYFQVVWVCCSCKATAA